jgi:hypothetical protein
LSRENILDSKQEAGFASADTNALGSRASAA